MPQEEAQKQVAAGAEGQEIRAFFDPFNLILQQLNRLDGKLEKLDEKLDTKIDGLRKEMENNMNELRREMKQDNQALHHELHSTTRWIIGTIIAAAGVTVALASWLF